MVGCAGGHWSTDEFRGDSLIRGDETDTRRHTFPLRRTDTRGLDCIFPEESLSG